MKHQKKRIFGILLSFALMLTMMPVLGLSQTAKATTTTTVTWNSVDFTAGSTTSKDGISIVGGQVLKNSAEVDFCSLDGYRISNGSFTTDLGNFTSVTVTEGSREVGFPGTGTGWDGNTWTGNSSTVPISGRMTDDFGGKPWTITFTIAIPTPYPLWVGKTQVNSANAGDILGDQTASYVAESNTLTLNGATITKGHRVDYGEYGDGEFGIYYNGSEPLNIDLAEGSVNTVKIEGSRESEIGIYVDDQNDPDEHPSGINISGKGQLTVSGTNDGIYAPNITIDGCDVTASGGDLGIRSYRGSTEIKAGSIVTASGGSKAIDGNVKNAIAGTGWTDSTGTGAGTPIAVNETGATLSYKKVQFPTAHTHDFTYSADGATITATCSADGCPLPEVEGEHVATLTIAAPLHTTYGDGKDAAAQITDANSIKGDAKVQYQKKTGESTYDTATETAPTNAGTYKASITVGSATASVEYTIAKADPTANAPSGLTATYGQTLSDVTLTNPSGNTEGTWAWVEAGTTSVGNVGTQTHKANFTPTDNANYNSVSNVDVSVTVNKAANPATVSSTASVKKGGNTVELADNVTKNGATGDVTYAFDGDNKGCTLDANGKLTSGTTTGSVIVNVSIATDDNYEALAATPITVTITEKDAQTITADDVTTTYGDADKKVSATTTGDGSISYAVKEGSTDYIDVNGTTGELTIIKVPADGKAYVTVTAAETKTYAPATRDVTVNINKKSVTVKANDKSIKVGEAVPDLSNPSLGKDYTVEGLVGGDALTTVPKLEYASKPDNTKPGTYEITASNASAGDNYDLSYQKGTLTISEKPAPAPTSKPVLAAKGISKGKTSLKFTWNKVDKAASYEVWMAKCGKKMKKVKSLSASKTGWTKKKLKRRTAYKFYVVAKDSSGNVISRSLTGHAITGNVKGKYTNPKSLTLKKSAYTLKKGKTATIKASVSKVKTNKKLATSHAATYRYTSNNPAVATVNAKGKVTAKAKGTAVIYVQTINGIWKTCKVTVN